MNSQISKMGIQCNGLKSSPEIVGIDSGGHSVSLSSSIDLSSVGSLSSKFTSSNSSVENSISSKTSDGGFKSEDPMLKRIEAECPESREGSFCNLNGISNKPHKGNDLRWDAIQFAKSKDGGLGLGHFRLLKKLGFGDIGSVYLAELLGTGCFFAVKVMDKSALEERKKLGRVRREREILSLLDHPFLPTLYSHFETEKFSCLVIEFCSGGDLHTLRQRQPNKHFSEQAARFYASEVLVALEYLHMMGVVYRDLKPENVLVREDGHIMLSDFDLSLKCHVNPTLVQSTSFGTEPYRRISNYCIHPSSCIDPACKLTVCIEPACLQTSCFTPRLFPKTRRARTGSTNLRSMDTMLPILIAEPTGARSMSFVGTHEYLAPEIIKGDGHGSAVDWWTFGIFLYELLHGRTPFKGTGSRATLFNVVGQELKFPETPSISTAAKDLIKSLLVKDPQQRLAYKRGATEIKQHHFFEDVNWALIRSTCPPDIPKPANLTVVDNTVGLSVLIDNNEATDSDNQSGSYLDFEFF